MVDVLHAAPEAAAPQAVAAWLDSLTPDYAADERASFAAAFDYARALRPDVAMPDGEAVLDRALGTATILAGLKLDPDSIRAALLLGLPVAGAFDADAVTAQFGADVATLVAGVARMGASLLRAASIFRRCRSSSAASSTRSRAAVMSRRRLRARRRGSRRCRPR